MFTSPGHVSFFRDGPADHVLDHRGAGSAKTRINCQRDWALPKYKFPRTIIRCVDLDAVGATSA
jgi:hypothetical protein